MLNSPLVSTDWLFEHFMDTDIRILDCTQVIQHHDDGSYSFVSGIKVWEENHIANSIYVDVGQELSDQDHEISLMMPDPEILGETFRQKGIGDDTTVICYDRGTHAWAARVWWLLRTCGFDNAAVLDGGWKKWIAENRPVNSLVTEYQPARKFSVNYRPEFMANKQEILSAISNDNILLIHSLPLPMFKGRINPYKRPGRIPGSKNLYCEKLVDPETNCFLPLDNIAEQFALTGSGDAEKIITYCGGGIAASANALALSLLGYQNIAVYDGSLSEWTNDPSLPMESG